MPWAMWDLTVSKATFHDARLTLLTFMMALAKTADNLCRELLWIALAGEARIISYLGHRDALNQVGSCRGTLHVRTLS